LKQFYKVLFSLLAIILLTSNCAKKGRPNGGLKDSLAPIMVTATPPYKSVHFNSKKIKISFDEYITLKNINQQLVISPPLKYNPIITPQGSPSKNITIKMVDTLLPNTTYTFNFGNSIQDNNEGNKLRSFKYVFSTGSYIDSLKTRGTVIDAYKTDFDKNISVLLFKIDSTYNDSIIYNKKPNYVSNTLDTTLFNITNVKKGKYLLIALKDVSNNYVFNPKEDKIGVYNRFIELPKDSIIKEPIYLYKEINEFRLTTPKQVYKGKIQFGFEGNNKNIEILLLSKVPEDFRAIKKNEPEKDTINYWHTTIKNDSLVFKITKNTFIDTVTVFLRKKIIDSLKINSNVSRTLDLRDTLILTTNNPVVHIDTTKIIFLDKDSLHVPFTHTLEKSTNKIKFLFDKKHNNNYKLTLLPATFTDIFETQNDTLNYNFATKEPDDYGSISINVVKGTSAPIIIELLSEKDKKVLQRVIVSRNKIVEFKLLPPGKYLIRGIIDTNNNQKWDTGNYLRKIQPEKIIYFPGVFNIRSNWYVSESFTIN